MACCKQICSDISAFGFVNVLQRLSLILQRVLYDATKEWGIKVEHVEIKDVKLPLSLQRAMAAEAQAVREARAKVSFYLSN